MQQFLDENTVFPPVNTDFFSSLMARYCHARNRVERVAEIFDSDLSGVVEHFVTGNLESDRVGIIDPVRLFKKERAIKALDASFWDQALRMTDVLDVMPQARRSDWFDQIRSLQTPEFEEESVRSTILSLLQRRHDFLAERIDGIFKGLSSEHVTNKPHAFSRRMIIHYVVCERFGSVESRKAGLITDLRSVISRFMGLNEIEWSSSFSLVAHARKYHGTWFDVDGGALRLRVYKKGTAHLEVHPDMAWRLNAILATIYPAVIPKEFRRKPAKEARSKAWRTLQRPLPLPVRKYLLEIRPAVDSEHRYRAQVASLPHISDRFIRAEVRQVLVGIGGIEDSNGDFHFDYEPFDVIKEVGYAGCVPDKQTHQFYPTPRNLADKLVRWVGILPNDKCLEPEAGNADIAKLMPKERTLCVELSSLRCTILKAQGFTVVNDDFLAYAGNTSDTFDVIVMNPPFSDGRWKAHLESAAALLNRNGRLAAVLPASAKDKNLLPGLRVDWSDVQETSFAGTTVNVVCLKAIRE